MKNLVFKEILILSKIEKRARRISLSPKMNVVIGVNDVGKSTLIKSLYHTLGGDTPKLGNSRWKRANAVYVLKFSLGQNEYSILRDERYFGLFDKDGALIGKYKGIASEGGVLEGINPLLGFNVELESKEGILRKLWPAYYFLPFYVDQDEGWSKSWASFSSLQGIKNYRTNLLDYHLGVRPQSYYDAQKKRFSLEKDREALEAKKNSFIDVRDNFKQRKNIQAVDIDPYIFRADIEELVQKYNQAQGQQQDQLSLLKTARNEALSIKGEIDILRKSARELEADYSYCESPTTPDALDCPTCGTTFENSVRERFGILDDIDYCRALIDQRQKDLILANEKVESLNKEYETRVKAPSSINEILNRKRMDVTFGEIVSAEGYKEIIRSLGEDISAIDSRQVEIDSELLDLKKKLQVDRETKKNVSVFYQKKMKEALNKLNVHVLHEDDYSTVYKAIGSNALGSDLPRALLAQYISFLHTMYEYNDFVICPLVIDSPLQQEQDNTNAKAIFNFIFNSLLENQQLILGTLDLDGKLDDVDFPEDCTIIKFDKKFELLTEDEYDEVLDEVAPMQEKTLSTE